MRATKVLLVEDEPSQASAVSRLLTDRGYLVRVAGDGRSALAGMGEWEPDVALLDIGLPDMSGLAVASTLRENALTRRVPLIALSRCNRPEDFVRGLLAGLDGYLEKPYSAPELLRVIEDALANARRRERQRALARDPDVTASLELSSEREQILAALLRAINRDVPCDLLAVWWKLDERTNLLVVVTGAPPSDWVVELARVSGIPRAELEAASTRLVVVPEVADAPGAAVSAGAASAPLTRGEECIGLMQLMNLRGIALDGAAMSVLADIAPVLSRLLIRGLGLDVTHESEAAKRLSEIELGVVCRDERSGAHLAERLECSVPGLRVQSIRPDDVPYLGDDFQVVLVDPELREEVEARMRTRAAHESIAVLDLDHDALAGSLRQLRAFCVMAILIAYMDGRRSGCLHVQGHPSGGASAVVFLDGRIAWASCAGSGASLASLLVSRVRGDQERVRAAVRRSASSRTPIADVLREDGLMDDGTFRETLKQYLVDVLREILRIAEPRVLRSDLVVPAPHNVSFDVDEITLAVFAA